MIRKWSIWIANLDPVKGSEQGKTRPVMVISEDSLNDILPVVNVIPITSRKSERRIYPNEVLINDRKTGLINESIILCYQIRTLDKSRLINEVGIISELKPQDEIINAIKFQLGID
ncbi:MAG: type II toxin-antitoxin system PemK/MazF family toxin [Bacteroidia bacterium]